jgi:SpoVK/Ycf46/Vps4 family AAA+-type ATPase
MGWHPLGRLSKDQLHASIVSTLLALVDGMPVDGRVHVVVIGATNRPDAVDPALRVIMCRVLRNSDLIQM